ncbi:MAG: ABC transporter permease [Bacteroidia bacterium]
MTELVIKPHNKFSPGIKELWLYRELAYLFAWREIKVKYKQAFLGFLWVILQPLLMMLMISYFLSGVVNVSHSEMPYFLYVLMGLNIWNLFSATVNNSVNQIIANANIIKKIYFPRLIIPLSSMMTAIFDFVITFSMMIVIILMTNVEMLFHFNLIYFILAILFTLFFAFSLSILLSALVVKYRDFRYILPFFIQILFFVSPVIYDISNKIPARYQWLIFFNPMNLSIDLFRYAFEKNMIVNAQYIIYQTIFLFLFFIIGIYTFRKTEEYIADVI